jgi:hypothetical protein
MLRAHGHDAASAMRAKVMTVAQELSRGALMPEPARAKLLQSRQAVVTGWLATAELLDAQGEAALAAQLRSFVRQMPPVMTDKERIAAGLLQTLRANRAAPERDRLPAERGQERTR